MDLKHYDLTLPAGYKGDGLWIQWNHYLLDMEKSLEGLIYYINFCQTPYEQKDITGGADLYQLKYHDYYIHTNFQTVRYSVEDGEQGGVGYYISNYYNSPESTDFSRKANATKRDYFFIPFAPSGLYTLAFYQNGSQSVAKAYYAQHGIDSLNHNAVGYIQTLNTTGIDRFLFNKNSGACNAYMVYGWSESAAAPVTLTTSTYWNTMYQNLNVDLYFSTAAYREPLFVDANIKIETQELANQKVLVYTITSNEGTTDLSINHLPAAKIEVF